MSSPISMKYAAGIVALALSAGMIGISAPAQAQVALPTSSTAPVTDPIVAYTAYNNAVNAGKLADAARHAALAWQLAETKWGATNTNTAGLAFNAAWSAALVGKSAERIDAARRAVELSPRAPDAYSLPEAQFLLAYAEYFAAEAKDRQSAARKLATAALPVEGTWNDYLIVNALVTAANLGTGERFGRATVAVADRALVVIDRISPSDTENRALAYLARARGRLTAGIDREEAVADLIQARVAYGPMRGLDDKSWGALAAWEMASRSVVATANSIQQTTGTRIAPRTRRPLDMTKDQLKRVYAEPTDDPLNPLECEGIQRDNRVGDDIQYPIGAANDYRVAGVVLRLDMNPDGTVVAPRLLGVVPPGPFGDNALRAVQTWKYKLPANLPPACLKNKEVGVSFVIY